MFDIKWKMNLFITKKWRKNNYTLLACLNPLLRKFEEVYQTNWPQSFEFPVNFWKLIFVPIKANCIFYLVIFEFCKNERKFIFTKRIHHFNSISFHLNSKPLSVFICLSMLCSCFLRIRIDVKLLQNVSIGKLCQHIDIHSFFTFDIHSPSNLKLWAARC